VFAVMTDKIHINGEERFVQDVMNPVGMFSNGVRQREYSTTSDPLPTSGKLIPEFFGRRNIRDMFARKPSLQQSQSLSIASKELTDSNANNAMPEIPTGVELAFATEGAEVPPPAVTVVSQKSPPAAGQKRSVAEASISKKSKRSKTGSAPATPLEAAKGQQSLTGFFKPKTAAPAKAVGNADKPTQSDAVNASHSLGPDIPLVTNPSPAACKSPNGIPSLPNSVDSTPTNGSIRHRSNPSGLEERSPSFACQSILQHQGDVHDPVETKESWSRLFTKPAAPRCEGHDEPCITLLTKKPGMNLGRSFWMCPRPLGPSGAKEKNTQWRCQTFIWCSDWNPTATNGG